MFLYEFMFALHYQGAKFFPFGSLSARDSTRASLDTFIGITMLALASSRAALYKSSH